MVLVLKSRINKQSKKEIMFLDLEKAFDDTNHVFRPREGFDDSVQQLTPIPAVWLDQQMVMLGFCNHDKDAGAEPMCG